MVSGSCESEKVNGQQRGGRKPVLGLGRPGEEPAPGHGHQVPEQMLNKSGNLVARSGKRAYGAHTISGSTGCQATTHQASLQRRQDGSRLPAARADLGAGLPLVTFSLLPRAHSAPALESPLKLSKEHSWTQVPGDLIRQTPC